MREGEQKRGRREEERKEGASKRGSRENERGEEREVKEQNVWIK